MKKFASAIIVLLFIIFGIGFGVVKLGIVPVNADVPPSALENRFIPPVVRASVERHADERPNPLPVTDDTLIAGSEIYSEMCARCHGLPGKNPSVLGASFYPPTPQFSTHSSEYTDSELFWIVKHGIRNTGMPAWGRLLSDEDIWRVASVVKRLNSLPPAAEASLKEHHNASGQ
jgi:mono/diheme cytochrome c family protein